MPVPALDPSLAAMMRDTSATDAVPRLLASPAHAFVLEHDPEAWEVDLVDGVQTWLPVVHKRILKPGADGVRTRKENELPDASFRTALDRDRYEGKTVIPLDTVFAAEFFPAGMPAGRYMRVVDVVEPGTNSPGVRHMEAWWVPVSTPTGRPQQFSFDRATYNRWRAHLVETGVVGECPGSTKATLVHRYRLRVEVAEIEPIPPDVRARKVVDAAKLAEAIEGATDVVKKKRGAK